VPWASTQMTPKNHTVTRNVLKPSIIPADRYNHKTSNE